MGIVEEVLTDFLSELRDLADTSYETLKELESMDELSDSSAMKSLVDSLSESTDDGEKQMSKAETEKYARMFRRDYNKVKRWAGVVTKWQNRYQRRPSAGIKKIVDKYAIELELAIEAFSKKVNEAKAQGK